MTPMKAWDEWTRGTGRRIEKDACTLLKKNLSKSVTNVLKLRVIFCAQVSIGYQRSTSKSGR
jgi:hypothetical protein